MCVSLTGNKQIPVEFARNTAADVICVFLVGGELSCIRDVPKSACVVIGPREDLVTI